MGQHDANKTPSKGELLSALFTLAYDGSLLFILYLMPTLYNLGRYQILPMQAFLFLGEIIKHFTFIQPSGQTTKKPPKLKLAHILKSIALFASTVLVYHITAILFGAPLLTETEGTSVFALLLAVLTATPLLLNFGPTQTANVFLRFTAYDGSDVHTQICLYTVRITLLGAWLGATVIPLDWDRPWQKWPIPCCLGAIAGHVAAQVFVLLLRVPAIGNAFLQKRSKYDL